MSQAQRKINESNHDQTNCVERERSNRKGNCTSEVNSESLDQVGPAQGTLSHGFRASVACAEVPARDEDDLASGIEANDAEVLGKHFGWGGRLWRGGWILLQEQLALVFRMENGRGVWNKLVRRGRQSVRHRFHEPLVLDEPIIRRLVPPLLLHLLQEPLEVLSPLGLLLEELLEEFRQLKTILRQDVLLHTNQRKKKKMKRIRLEGFP